MYDPPKTNVRTSKNRFEKGARWQVFSIILLLFWTAYTLLRHYTLVYEPEFTENMPAELVNTLRIRLFLLCALIIFVSIAFFKPRIAAALILIVFIGDLYNSFRNFDSNLLNYWEFHGFETIYLMLFLIIIVFRYRNDSKPRNMDIIY